MLVAAIDMKVWGELVRKGEPIPRPEKWDYSALRANIELGHVVEVSDSVSPPEAPQAEAQPSVEPEPLGVECQHCRKQFKNKQGLSTHLRSHR